ncbi:DNA sulfur modification protein DndD [Shouchella shacheensis]|uniref:DNA sulfur modification protein DndD n=1 Tax=Shouchella shacheensis TaxID=1649580 RepID=UPI00073FF99A|nr:DNA sulfur modification protein DndD [Shouchella shacheensis]
MKFEKVIFKNIGAYKGVHEIDLTVKPPDQNVILFGGKNGSGKTTLLNAIKISLFGAFTYGYATENDRYLQQVKSLLNSPAYKQNENSFQIILEFSEVEKYQLNKYRFTRQWNFVNDKLKENFMIMKNGNYLNEKDREIYHTGLKKKVPLELFNMCLFDGEEISKIVSNNQLSEYLRSSASVLFNLNLFSSLEEDLGQYMKQANIENSINDQEAKVYDLENALSNLIKQRERLTLENNSLQHDITQLEERVEVLKKDFNINGGLVDEERQKLQSEVNQIENTRTQNIQELKDFTADLLPIYLARKLLFQTKDQMSKEHNFELMSQVKQTLTPRDFQSNISELVPDPSKAEILRERILSMFKEPDVELIHQASFQQRSEIEALSNTIENLKIDEYIQLLTENQGLLKKAKDIRKQLEHHQTTTDFEDMFEEIESLSVKITQKEQKSSSVQRQLNELNQEISTQQQSIEVAQKKLLENEKANNSFFMATKIRLLSQQFRKQQTKKKLQLVQIEATKILNALMRKKDYVSSILIHPETFEISLYNRNHVEVPKEHLSSGEKQILLLSIILAMLKCSGVKFPFIFDTLLGRLDVEHRETVLSKLIPNCSEQVMILSTNSEIDLHLYPIIEPLVAKEYTLNFAPTDETISIEHGFFHYNQEVRSL